MQEMATSMEADAEDLLVVDFQATWCGPCKMMVPVIQQLARVQYFSLSMRSSRLLVGRMGHVCEGQASRLCWRCPPTPHYEKWKYYTVLAKPVFR